MKLGIGGNSYAFNSLLEGVYVVKVIPLDTETYFTTYAGNMVSLADAVLTQLDINQTVDILMMDIPSFQGNGGNGTITGTLAESTTGGRMMGTPLAGVNVYLIDPVTGEIVGYATTDENGEFTFENLLPGDYIISVDYEGLPIDGATITMGDEAEPVVLKLSVSEESIAVQVVKIAGLQDALFASLINSYPNPFEQEINLQMQNEETGLVILRVVNLTGIVVKKVEWMKADVSLNRILNLSELSHGTYLLEIRQGDRLAIELLLKK